MKNKKKSAFSLLELSIITLVVGILISAVLRGTILTYKTSLNSARILTQNSPVTTMKKSLVLWLETTSEKSFLDSEAGDNLSVSTWYDINPTTTTPSNATQSSSSSKPKYNITNGINGLPALKFDGSNDSISISSSTYLPLASTTPETFNNFSIFIVAQATSSRTAETESATANGGSGQKYLLYPFTGAVYSDVNALGVGIAVGTNAISVYERNTSTMTPLAVYSATLNKPMIILVEYNDSTPTIYVNGTSVHTGLQSTADYSFPSGSFGGGSLGDFSGYIGEVIVFNTVLEDEDRDDVHNYLNKKWRIY